MILKILAWLFSQLQIQSGRVGSSTLFEISRGLADGTTEAIIRRSRDVEQAKVYPSNQPLRKRLVQSGRMALDDRRERLLAERERLRRAQEAGNGGSG